MDPSENKKKITISEPDEDPKYPSRTGPCRSSGASGLIRVDFRPRESSSEGHWWAQICPSVGANSDSDGRWAQELVARPSVGSNRCRDRQEAPRKPRSCFDRSLGRSGGRKSLSCGQCARGSLYVGSRAPLSVFSNNF